jgi:hypothetical protein
VVGIADETFFDELLNEIRLLKEDHDTVVLPTVTEQGAWRKAWEIRERLRTRPKAKVIPPKVDLYEHHKATARELVQARSYVKSAIFHTGLNEDYCMQLLGVTAEDFANTVPETIAEMNAIADRLLPVYRELKLLNMAEKQAFFLDKRLHQLETRLAALEAAK